MRALIRGVLLAAAFMPLGLRPASAQAEDIFRQLIVHCRADAAELCSDVEPGGGRIAACLYSRIDDLSPRCHRAMRDGIALRFCGDDYYRYCQDVPLGEGRLTRCLRDYRDEVSPRCANALASKIPHRRDREYGWRDRDYNWRDRSPRYAVPYERKQPEPETDEDQAEPSDDLK
jgi:hypothetical protein